MLATLDSPRLIHPQIIQVSKLLLAQDASLTVNGVQITRTTNTITDLIDGYEFKLNNTTSSAASVIASIDADLAYSTVKGLLMFLIV